MTAAEKKSARDGTDLAARFSYITNNLQYCGPTEAANQFLTYINHKQGKDAVRESITRFEGLYPNLLVIGEANGKDFLDYDVVEAYWIGNKLLENVTREHLLKILDLLGTRGMPKALAEKLKRELPDGFVPHHDYHVLYAGPGNTAQTVNPKLIATRDSCRVSSGVVVRVEKKELVVKTRPLLLKEKQYVLGPVATQTVQYEPALLPHVKQGDIVAIHWSFATTLLTPEQEKNLAHYSTRVRDVMNEWLTTHEHDVH